MLKRIGGDRTINRIIWRLLWVNGASSLAIGFIVPFITVFADKSIEGGNVIIAGLAAGMSPIIQGIAQLPGGWLLDRLSKDNDRALFRFFIAQQIINALYFLCFIPISLPWHLFALQAVRGAATGLTMPAGSIIQSKYIDQGNEGWEWGMNGAIVHVFYGLGPIIGGVLIARFGFDAVFLIGFLLSVLATFFALKMLRISSAKQKAGRTATQGGHA